MAERNLNFDTIIDRRRTNSLKYDFAEKNGMPEDILPLWVADMDFRISSYIQDALIKQAEHGIYGYSESGGSYFEAVSAWMKDHHGWDVEEEWLVKTPGIVYALATAVRAFTKEGDGVLIQQPVYYPFSKVILDNGRKIVNSGLIQDKDGRYQIDYDDFEKKIIKEQVKLFILCNPHNPVGRVWSREELETIGDICKKHQVIVVSDEIHFDFVWEGEHHVFASLKEEYRDMAVVCTAPSKTFNIAGLQASNIFIPAGELRKRFLDAMRPTGISEINGAGLVACEAAYRHGEEWYQGVCEYIKGNMQFVKEYLHKYIPKISMCMPEGTYLVWLDFRQLALSEEELEDLVIKKAGLWRDKGTIFGKAGLGFQRVNVACPRKVLETALCRLKAAIDQEN